MSKNVRKSEEKARINWGWDTPENRNGKATRKTKKQVDSTIKKVGTKGLIIVVICFLFGLLIGIASIFFISKNDCFEIVGKDLLTLTLGENYDDEGVKIISLGKNLSSEYTLETDLIVNDDGSLTANEIGTYYIKYKSNDIKYGRIFTVEKIRLITFVEETIEEEKEVE